MKQTARISQVSDEGVGHGGRSDAKGLETRVSELEEEVRRLWQSLAGPALPEDLEGDGPVVADADARKAIVALFEANADNTFYYGDIAEQLDLDLAQVVRICSELEQEERIEFDDRA